MANIEILYDSVSDDGSFSGGSWSGTLPLANLVDQQPTKVARSADALVTSTKFVIDLGSAQQVSMFVLINVNFSDIATVRFRLSNASDGSTPLIDATIGMTPANIIWGSLPWGSFPWTGVVPSVEPGGQPGGPNIFYLNDTAESGRYILVDISDTTNTAGYVQAGRFMAGNSFSPSINMAFGAQILFVDPSRQSRSIGQQLWTDVKPKHRKFTCNLNWLTQAEAMGDIYDIQRILGISGALFMVFDPDDDGTVIARRALYGVNAQLDPIVVANPGDNGYTAALTIEELN